MIQLKAGAITFTSGTLDESKKADPDPSPSTLEAKEVERAAPLQCPLGQPVLSNPLESYAVTLKGSKSRKDNWKYTKLLALIDEDGSSRDRDENPRYELETATLEGKVFYPWMYGKCLDNTQSSKLHAPTKNDIDKLLKFIKTPTKEGLRNLPHYPSARKHEDVIGGFGFEPQGIDVLSGNYVDIIKEHYVAANSLEGFHELIEVYAMALMRDIPFDEWNSSNETVSKVLSALGEFSPDLSASTLFRGTAGDEEKGYYISQLLLNDFVQGNMPIRQRYFSRNDSVVNRTRVGFEEMIQGQLGADPSTDLGEAKRVYQLRVLGSLVQKDPAYAIYFNAALQLMGKAGSDGVMNDSIDSSNFIETGGPDILSILGFVTRSALRVAWSIKWGTSMKIRPEQYADHCESASGMSEEDAQRVPGFRDLKERMERNGIKQILKLIKEKNKTDIESLIPETERATGEDHASLRLPLIYQEGSPAHPSFCAGHAVVAGACCTILKAMIKTHHPDGSKILWKELMGNPVSVSTDDRTTLISHDITSGETITGEINKLASNIAMGRNAAGVHYKCDSLCGLAVGEQVAINFLKIQAKCYYPEIVRDRVKFVFETFDRKLETITGA